MIMKKFIIWTLIFISLAVLILRFSSRLGEFFLGVKQNSGISIFSEPNGATVFLDNKEVGKTPFEDKNLESKEYLVKLEKDQAVWQGKIKLTAGTVGIIERDLAKDPASSAGETLILEKGTGMTIISTPQDAQIEIDGKNYGKTPKTIDIVASDHTIVLTHPNYLNRSIKAVLPNNFNLTVTVDLALSEADLSTISTPAISKTQKLIVKNTPTGFLRIREKPSLSAKELARALSGEDLILLEETGDWDRVRLPNGVEGYVSSVYVEKRHPETGSD